MHADLARKSKERELEEWEQLKVHSTVEMGGQSKDVVVTRWALTRKEAEGSTTVKARLVAEGYRGPDLRNGDVDIAGCVSRRSPHLQPIYLGESKK